jgi:hypothetical protein
MQRGKKVEKERGTRRWIESKHRRRQIYAKRRRKSARENKSLCDKVGGLRHRSAEIRKRNSGPWRSCRFTEECKM